MNKIIEELKELIEENEKEIKEMNYIFKTRKDQLSDELFKENKAINSVLKYNPNNILKIITDNKLKCCSMGNIDILWGDAEYTITDGHYRTCIYAEEGKVVSGNRGIDNDGGGKELYRIVKTFLLPKINRYCEQNKYKYYKED